METKVCRICKIDKDMNLYPLSWYSKKPCGNLCKKCKGDKDKEWNKNNIEKVKEYNKKKYSKHREKINLKSKKWRERHPEYLKEWKKQNPHKNSEHKGKRKNIFKNQSNIINAIDESSYKNIYDLRMELGNEFQVDHIVPIIHPKVCGLHVPWNLQILTKSENGTKKNSFDGTPENESWRKK
jgi:hypothetical protein